jgi:hypothetical protein
VFVRGIVDDSLSLSHLSSPLSRETLPLSLFLLPKLGSSEAESIQSKACLKAAIQPKAKATQPQEEKEQAEGTEK